MSDVMFTGVFYETTLDAVCDHLLTTLGVERDAAPLKRRDDEAEYEDDTLEVFVQSLGSRGDYSMEAEYHGPLDAAETWLTGFIADLRARGALFQFDLWEEDDDGEVLGEMRAFRGIPSGYRGAP